MAADGVPPSLQAVTSRLSKMVDVVAKVLRPAMIAGFVATAVIALSLTPWLFHTTVAAVIWCLIVAVGAGAALRLAWHSRLLRTTIGRPQFVVESLATLNQVGGDQAQRLGRQLDDIAHADQGTRARSAFRMLRDVRNLSAIRDLGDAANELVAPISPQRLVLSGYAVAVVIGAVVLAVPIALGSLLGLLLR